MDIKNKQTFYYYFRSTSVVTPSIFFLYELELNLMH